MKLLPDKLPEEEEEKTRLERRRIPPTRASMEEERPEGLGSSEREKHTHEQGD